MKFEKKDYILIIIVVLLGLVLLFITKEEKNNEVKNSYKRLNEPSTFFTLESCANRYIKNLSEKNKTNLVKLIDEDYQDNHGINHSNIVNKLDNLDGSFTFKAKKIYYEQIDKNNYKYYVYGYYKKILSINMTMELIII